MLIRWLLPAMVLMPALPAAATTFAPVDKTCPIGGEKFTAMEMMSTTTWGALPDGMPLGVGPSPAPLPQCPGNGLVLYKDFDAASLPKLAALVASERYRSRRAAETSYYLAYLAATELGDAEAAPWLLLSATWEAKNDGPAERATRYMAEFVDLAGARAFDPKSFESIALRARIANALRELGRFEAADALIGSSAIAPDAGGDSSDAAQNRNGWLAFLTALKTVIARHDASRDPIDMLGARIAAERCLDPASSAGPTDAPLRKPLTVFEQAYCKRPEIARETTALRKLRAR